MPPRSSATLAATLVLALALSAHAQLTGGRLGGSSWGRPHPSTPTPTRVTAPDPARVGSPSPTPAPGLSPQSPAVVFPAPTITPAVPVQSALPPPEPSAPPPRIAVHQWQRETPSPGVVVGAAEERVVDEAERIARAPLWSGGEQRGPLRHGPGAVAGGLAFTLVFGLTVMFTRPRRNPGGAPRPGPSRPPASGAPPIRPAAHPGVELRQVSVAFDASARAWIQQELAALGLRVDPSTPAGLHALAVGARDLLGSAHQAARYAMFQSLAFGPEEARARFAQLADRARARYTVETVDNARRIVGPALHPKSEEGAGLVVVTLLVAARGPLESLPPSLDLPSVLGALQGSVPLRAERLLALEVIWSPAAEADRMSSAELVVLYPELLPLGVPSPLGRGVCAYCRAVFALELGRCPACGAR